MKGDIIFLIQIVRIVIKVMRMVSLYFVFMVIVVICYYRFGMFVKFEQCLYCFIILNLLLKVFFGQLQCLNILKYIGILLSCFCSQYGMQNLKLVFIVVRRDSRVQNILIFESLVIVVGCLCVCCISFVFYELLLFSFVCIIGSMLCSNWDFFIVFNFIEVYLWLCFVCGFVLLLIQIIIF